METETQSTGASADPLESNVVLQIDLTSSKAADRFKRIINTDARHVGKGISNLFHHSLNGFGTAAAFRQYPCRVVVHQTGRIVWSKLETLEQSRMVFTFAKSAS